MSGRGAMMRGICSRCERDFQVRSDGFIRQHWHGDALCSGSGKVASAPFTRRPVKRRMPKRPPSAMPRAACSGCGHTFFIRYDGTVLPHQSVDSWPNLCSGSNVRPGPSPNPLTNPSSCVAGVGVPSGPGRATSSVPPDSG